MVYICWTFKFSTENKSDCLLIKCSLAEHKVNVELSVSAFVYQVIATMACLFFELGVSWPRSLRIHDTKGWMMLTEQRLEIT